MLKKIFFSSPLQEIVELAVRGCHGDDVHTKLQLLILLSTSHIIQQGFICSSSMIRGQTQREARGIKGHLESFKIEVKCLKSETTNCSSHTKLLLLLKLCPPLNFVALRQTKPVFKACYWNQNWLFTACVGLRFNQHCPL